VYRVFRVDKVYKDLRVPRDLRALKDQLVLQVILV
jgi:hypothetical protein